MGVPSFYRWLVNKYPKIVENAKQDTCQNLDISCPNPNGLEFDHFYLDMNGIIHPCFHPDHQLFPPTTIAEVFENIYQYIDHLVSIVRPRKLLYLAIDGVAPRAKQNQQRSRRFRTAKDNEIAEEEEKRLREEFEKMGKTVLPKIESEVSDSNIITPGTEFMYELSQALQSYVSRKLRDDPGWRDLKVVLSDASVPGEGEHKIMSFIRSLRTLPDYYPNTRHCLYGLDADLIMLALQTHEIHFSILREEVLAVPDETPTSESALLTCIKKFENVGVSKSNKTEKPFFDVHDRKKSLIGRQRYQLLHIWILREYLELDMQINNPPEKFVFDIERIIDDFIFICFFAGNDFLPHMPTVQLHENGVDLLMHVYKNEMKSLGGYIVDMQRVNDPHAAFLKLKRVERFILSVGSYEESIFKKRTELRERKRRRILSELSELQEDEPDNDVSEVFEPDTQLQNNLSLDNEEILVNTKELKEKLKNCLRKKSDLFKDGNFGADKVKLGSIGWKQRYYQEKFSVDDPEEVESKRKEIVEKYAEGLCWILMYYYSGVPSWDWYYPYHYGPFASDLKGLGQVKVTLRKGLPFRPFDQLMAVLPPRSAHALPKAYRELMLDCNSSIIEFYPNDIEIDVDGKRYHWQGVCKLPFIQEEALLSATRKLDGNLEESEVERNTETNDQLFMRGLTSCEGEIWYRIWMHRVNKEEALPAKEQDGILSFRYELPLASLHLPRLLEGVHPPEKIIFENDIMETTLWHESRGSRPISRFPGQNRHREAMNNVMKMEMENEFSPHKHPGLGHGFNSMGRGMMTRSNPPEPNYRYVNSRPPHGYVQNPPRQFYRPVTVSQPHPNYPSGSHQRPTHCAQPASQVYSFRPAPNYANRSHQGGAQPASQVYSFRPAPNYANRSHQGGAQPMQNSCWPSRNGRVEAENCSWRSVGSYRASNGNNQQMTGRGRGRGGQSASTPKRNDNNQRQSNRW